MKPTLYEALGLSQTAAESEIKDALRRLVRRYYAKTRAGHTDVEEALRFLNHASHILGNPARRAEYDGDLAENARAESTLTPIGESPQRNEAPVATTVTDGGASITQLDLSRDRVPASIEVAPEWGAQLADIRRTRAGQLGGLLIVSFVFLLVWNYALPAGNAVPAIKFALVMLTLLLGAAAVVFAIVHVLSRSIWRAPVPQGASTLAEGMIPRWRRDRTVFMGPGAPIEDATWLFRLRMAELKRVSAERVSDPQPAMRLLARLFDYGMWSLAILAVASLLVRLGVVPIALAELLFHPLFAPVWITASWIPVEAFLLTRIQTTPGRWLLCVYLHYEVSNPYAPEELRFTFSAAVRRAAEVWWRGCGAWLPVVSLAAMARAREHVSRAGETRWDSERDCLVTHGPVGNLSMFTLALGLAACILVLAVRWKEPVQVMAERWHQGWTAVVGHFESSGTPATAPVVAAPPPGVSRIDDVSPPPAAPASALPAPSALAPPPVVRAPDLSPKTPPTRNPEPVLAPAKAAAGAAKPLAPERSTTTANLQKPPPVAPPVATPAEPALGPIELRDRRIAAYTRQAQRQQAAGDFSGLARTCQQWADDDWRNPRAYYCAGLGLQGMGQHKQAIAMFNKAGVLLSRDDPLKTLIDSAVLKSFLAQSGG